MKNEKYLIESIVTKDYNTPYAQEDTYKILLLQWHPAYFQQRSTEHSRAF